MAVPVRPRLLAAVMAAAVAISLIGAVIWSGTVARDDERVDAVLDTPGDYLEPGASTNPPLPTDRVPAVELTTPDGDVVELRSDGRPMVVNLWYSTCPPCARELVEFGDVHASLGDSVRFVGVNPLDDPDVMTRFAADRGVTYELLRDPEGALADQLGVVAYPVTVFVGRDGFILERTGPIDGDELRRRLATYWAVG